MGEVTINFVTTDLKDGELVLYLVEDGPWPTVEAEWELKLKRIQDRILDTVQAVLDGPVLAKYPHAAGKRVRIQVDSPQGCPEPLAD